MHTEGRESELLIALAQMRNELAREKDRSAGLKASKDNLSRMYGEQCGEVKRLRAALEKHGCHEVECEANKEEDDQFCNCGLTAALAGGWDR